MKNRFGLTRNIPSAVKKEVRRRCGFGCVICGSAIVTYEHFSPNFADASMHDPAGITLLCGSHQIESTKGLLPKSLIQEGNLNPFCRQHGHAKSMLNIGKGRPKLILGSNDFTKCGPRIVFAGETIFEIKVPEKYSSLWRLSARFGDDAGTAICEIKDNELFVPSDSFDFTQTKTRFTVSLPSGPPFLDIELRPPHTFLLLKYTLKTGGGSFRFYEEVVEAPSGDPSSKRKTGKLNIATGGTDVTFVNCEFLSETGLSIGFKNGQVVLSAV